MKTKIKEVQNYFKRKMLSGEFVIADVEEYSIDLLIDDEYKFIIWIGNVNIPETRKLHSGRLSFIAIELSDDEAIKLNEILLPAINKFRKQTLLEQKRREFERLQNELNNIY